MIIPGNSFDPGMLVAVLLALGVITCIGMGKDRQKQKVLAGVGVFAVVMGSIGSQTNIFWHVVIGIGLVMVIALLWRMAKQF